jgi:hypothetical protein
MVVVHKLLGSSDELAELISKALTYSEKPSIIDLCSGSGGPMIEVAKILTEKYRIDNLTLTLTDVFPNIGLASKINSNNTSNVSYLTTPVDATKLNFDLIGVRTMVCSFHHMKPDTARNILLDAKERKQPICIFEISDNSFPFFLWWVALPLNFIMAFFITPFVRPLTWKQIIFTYFIPILPFFFAWDGAVSNARTYTLDDLEILIDDLKTEDYQWEKGSIPGKAKKIYLLGLPKRK